MIVDAGMVKENYARMTDEQLVNLAKNDGQDLTPEALSLLHEEFISRKLDTDVFVTLDDDKTAQRKRTIEKAQEHASNEFINSVWNYAFEEKNEGTSSEEIQKGLMERGLDEQHAALIIKTLESKATEILDAHNTDMLRGALTCFFGLVITVWTYTSALHGGTYLVAWGAIIFGAIRFFKGMANTGKYKTIIAVIQAEQAAEKATVS